VLFIVYHAHGILAAWPPYVRRFICLEGKRKMVKSKKTKSRFQYQQRTREDVKRRANQSGGLFDSLFKAQFSTFTPKEGKNQVRILPATWDKPTHYGMDVFVHYGIGSDNQSYLCLDATKGEKCPICEERKQADRAGDSDYAKSLQATKRVLVWVINRGAESDGPQLWSMPWTIDRDINSLTLEEEGGILAMDDPEDGYDVHITRTGTGLKTKYLVKIARRASPLADDPDKAQEWLDFIVENPLPEVLQCFDYDHIASVAQGKKSAKDEEDEEEEDEIRPTKRQSARSATKSTASVTSRSKDEDEEDEEEEDEEEEDKAEEDEDEEDEDEVEEEEDDEEDDLPPKRSGKKRSR